METVRENETIAPDRARLLRDLAPGAGAPTAATGYTDTSSTSQRAAKSSRAILWVAAGIRVFILFLAGALTALIAREWDWWVGSAVEQSTDDAYLQADMTPLAAKSPGYVRVVPVNDFQKVRAGDLLVEIVDDDYRAQLDQAQANVANAEAAVELIQQQKVLQEAFIKQAEATIRATEADLTRYHLERLRQQDLLGRAAGTPQLVEQAVDNENRTQATLDLNRAQLQQQRQQVSVLDSQIKQAQATLKAQQAARDLAQINLGYTPIARPQFLLAPTIATILRFIDARWLIAVGFALIGGACLMAGRLTHDWAGNNFLPSQLVQAVGQSLALTALVWFALKHLEPAEVLTFGAMLQIARLFGAQLGAGFVQTFVRVREQLYSNLVGLHVTTSSLLTDQRLADYARAVVGRSLGQAEANARATALLARALQGQAYVLAFIDTFMVIGFGMVGALLLMLLVRAPPARPSRPNR
jgi:multidrug efflux pump subunit AcrA (membrane-fusion protein)